MGIIKVPYANDSTMVLVLNDPESRKEAFAKARELAKKLMVGKKYKNDKLKLILFINSDEL